MFAKNIKYLRNKFDMEQSELAEKLGRKSSSSISEWEKGKYTPKIGTLNEIAKIFNVNIDDLMTLDLSINTSSDISTIFNQLDSKRKKSVLSFAQSQLETQENKVINLESYQEVNIQSKVSAGSGIVDLDPQNEDIVTIYGRIPDKYDMAFEVSGNSMEPLFEDGEIIYIEKTTNISNGQIIVVQINDEAYIKKAYLEDDFLRLVSLNKDYKDIITTDIDDIRVIGKVIL